jgi:hypothetical protein
VPNGFHHRDDLDLLTLSYTEQGYPELRIRQMWDGVRVLYTLGHRGYAPSVDWSKYVEPALVRGAAVTRAAVEELASRYVASLQAALLANTEDPLHPTMRRASLAWLSVERGWAIVIGQVYLFGRVGDGFVHVPRASELAFAEIPPDIRRTLVDAEITADGLVPPSATAAGCVFPLAAYDEVLCASMPLHYEPEWAEIAPRRVDDPYAVGLIIGSMRRHAHELGRDAFVVRWRRSAKA